MSTEPSEILDRSLAEIQLEDLNIDEHLTQLLVGKGYATIGDIYDLQMEGISLVTGVEFETADQLWKRVLEVVSNPENWTLQISEAPPETQQDDILLLPNILQSAIEDFFHENNKSRIYTILVRRFGLNSKRYTLEQVGVIKRATMVLPQIL